ncbi:MAG: hypothetical protein R3D57_17685 [Hyphomicrobiaceae bacterium]
MGMSVEQSLVELFGTGALSLTASLGGRGRAGILPEDGDAFVRFLIAAGPETNPADALAHFAREVKAEIASAHLDLDDVPRIAARLATLVGEFPISPVMAREALQHQRMHGGRRNGSEPPAMRLAEHIVTRAEAEGALDRLGIDALPAVAVLEGLFRALLTSDDMLDAAVAVSAPYRREPDEPSPADPEEIFAATAEEEAAAPTDDGLPSELRELVRRVADHADVPPAFLASLLQHFAARDFPRDRLEWALEQKAKAYRELKSEAERPIEADLTVQRLRAESLACLADGQIEQAEFTLSGALSKAMTDGLAHPGPGSTTAQILALQGRIAEIRLAYREAGSRYETAASDPAVETDRTWHWSLLMRQAAALQREAEEFGDFSALGQAVIVLAQALDVVPLATAPLNHATTQRTLGDALLALGSHEKNFTELGAAADCYSVAQNILSRTEAPTDWARLEAGRGLVYLRKGDIEASRNNAEKAIEHFKNALTVFRRETTPGDWAMTEVNLATAYSRLSAHEDSTRSLSDAVDAYRRVLIDYPRGEQPAEYARLQSNLGNVLAELGERTGDARWLDLAITAYRETLHVWTREIDPLKWALGNANLGNALWALGELGGDAALMQEAATSIVHSLDVFRDLGEQQYEQTALDNLRALHEDLKRMADKVASYG